MTAPGSRRGIRGHVGRQSGARHAPLAQRVKNSRNGCAPLRGDIRRPSTYCGHCLPHTPRGGSRQRQSAIRKRDQPQGEGNGTNSGKLPLRRHSLPVERRAIKDACIRLPALPETVRGGNFNFRWSSRRKSQARGTAPDSLRRHQGQRRGDTALLLPNLRHTAVLRVRRRARPCFHQDCNTRRPVNHRSSESSHALSNSP